MYDYLLVANLLSTNLTGQTTVRAEEEEKNTTVEMIREQPWQTAA